MSAGAVGALLVYSALVATTVWGQPFQNNIIGFNNQRIPLSHSANNFNPLSSRLVNSFSSFGRPLPISNFPRRRFPRIPAAQSNGILFNQNLGQQGAITFGRPINTPFSFSNKPTQSNTPRTPISFGGGPVIFPGSGPSISNKPVVSGPPTTSVNVNTTPTQGSPSIFFPGQVTKPAGGSSVTDANTPNIIEDSNCMLKEGTAYFNGNCEILLSRASCPEDHWLLLDVTGSPYCAERQCPWGQLNYLGDCVDPGDQVCNRGQILYVELTGLVECDCEPEFVFDSVSGNCYGIHEQGFCEDAKYLERDQEGKVVCVPNPCVNDKYVEQHGVCYEKNYRGYCNQNQVLVLPQTGTADCIFILPHSIFEVQELTACPPGSRRDFFNQCRGMFRVASQSSFPTSRGDCPPNFVKDPRGTCRKVVNLFG